MLITLQTVNTLELCLDDADEKWVLYQKNTNSECGPVQSYNVITVPKINNNQSVVFIRN